MSARNLASGRTLRARPAPIASGQQLASNRKSVAAAVSNLASLKFNVGKNSMYMLLLMV